MLNCYAGSSRQRQPRNWIIIKNFYFPHLVLPFSTQTRSLGDAKDDASLSKKRPAQCPLWTHSPFTSLHAPKSPAPPPLGCPPQYWVYHWQIVIPASMRPISLPLRRDSLRDLHLSFMNTLMCWCSSNGGQDVCMRAGGGGGLRAHRRLKKKKQRNIKSAFFFPNVEMHFTSFQWCDSNLCKWFIGKSFMHITLTEGRLNVQISREI